MVACYNRMFCCDLIGPALLAVALVTLGHCKLCNVRNNRFSQWSQIDKQLQLLQVHFNWWQGTVADNVTVWCDRIELEDDHLTLHRTTSWQTVYAKTLLHILCSHSSTIKCIVCVESFGVLTQVEVGNWNTTLWQQWHRRIYCHWFILQEIAFVQ